MKSIEAIANKFKSGNSIPCEFARVYLAEWQAIVAEVAKLEADVLSARADGRGEVLAEFLADDPDADWFGEFIIDGGQDESGEHSCYWDEPALLQKFRATDRAWSAIREADDSRIDYLMKCDQAEDELSQLRAKVEALSAERDAALNRSSDLMATNGRLRQQIEAFRDQVAGDCL